MPIYEYSCAHCLKTMEIIHKMNEPAKEICPACNEPGLVKLISKSDFRLVGNGWFSGTKTIHKGMTDD